MFTNFAIGDFSTVDLIIILVIILLLFGAKKLPELSKSLGQSARELRKGLTGDVHEDKKNEQPKQENDAS